MTLYITLNFIRYDKKFCQYFVKTAVWTAGKVGLALSLGSKAESHTVPPVLTIQILTAALSSSTCLLCAV